MDNKQIVKEILEEVDRLNPGKNEKIINDVKKELKVLSMTEGINGVNNLESFYNIWKKYKGKKGNKNVINSWTAYALNLTDCKPNGDFLPKRRAFARAGFPDIDTDFDDDMRDSVYDYIIDKYGRENVGNIGTHGLLKFKSCVTRVSKALDVANAFHKGADAYRSENKARVDEILEPFPKKGIIKIKDQNQDMQVIKSVDDAYQYCPDFAREMDKYDGIMDYLRDIEGIIANFSAHAAGIVVSDIPIKQIAPLRKARGDLLATQFTGEQLESLGLIKFDILAISTLTVIKRTIKLIKENYDIDIDIKNISLDNKKTFKLYREGNLGGVFQCEQYGMQNTMKDIGVDSFDDIMAAISLYRPGPMANIPLYCSRKKGESRIDYFHPSIEKHVKPFLENTYGLIIYQEQLMQICNTLAGFSITDGYIMIKAIGKKKKHLMEKFEKQFIEGCVKNEVPKDVAEQYWKEFIVPFASYGFNKSHACCYAFNSYLTCYLKANYTAEFICSLLDVESGRGNQDKINSYEKEFTNKLNIEFLPRDINHCKVSYKVEKKSGKKIYIRPSLLCKGLGSASAQNIEDNQPYSGLEDLARKTDSVVDTRAIESLAEWGYLGKKAMKDKEQVAKKFAKIRVDIKKAIKKGIDSVDMFK